MMSIRPFVYRVSNRGIILGTKNDVISIAVLSVLFCTFVSMSDVSNRRKIFGVYAGIIPVVTLINMILVLTLVLVATDAFTEFVTGTQRNKWREDNLFLTHSLREVASMLFCKHIISDREIAFLRN